MKALYIRLDNFTKENTDLESRQYTKVYTCCTNLASLVEDYKRYNNITENDKVGMLIFETKKQWEADALAFINNCKKPVNVPLF